MLVPASPRNFRRVSINFHAWDDVLALAVVRANFIIITIADQRKEKAVRRFFARRGPHDTPVMLPILLIPRDAFHIVGNGAVRYRTGT